MQSEHSGMAKQQYLEQGELQLLENGQVLQRLISRNMRLLKKS